MSETTSEYTAGDQHPSPLEVAVGRLDQAMAKVDDLRELLRTARAEQREGPGRPAGAGPPAVHAGAAVSHAWGNHAYMGYPIVRRFARGCASPGSTFRRGGQHGPPPPERPATGFRKGVGTIETRPLAGLRIDFAALSRSLCADARQPPSTRHRRTPDPPELAAALARYAQTRAALEAARSVYQGAKAEHAASKAALLDARARAGAVSGGTTVEPPDSRG